MGDPCDITSDQVWEDQRAAYDAMRSRCPVAHDDGTWMILRHAEVVAAATDPETFSSAVTARRAIPNSLDGAEHAAFRRIVDRYMTPERVAREEAQCRSHAAAIIDALPRGETVRTVAQLGVPFAVRTQSRWLGWTAELEDELVAWMADNHAATRSGDRSRTAAVAARFDALIHGLLDARRDADPGTDVTAELMHETIDGRLLTDEEIVSILRNWTAGDLGSIATSVGVVVHFLASHPDEQERLRQLATPKAEGAAPEGAAPEGAAALEDAIEEILRIDDPFVSNRRRATREVDLGGETIPAGARVILNWTAANRDPLVFPDPDSFGPAAHASDNLVFGIGPHVCPGRALTLMELRVVTEELLGRTSSVTLSPERPTVRENPPVGGWARVPVVLR
jgi:cytochrome P450